MNSTLDEIANEYRWAVREYLTGAGEAALRRAYEIGRKGLAGGVGVLEMAQVHQQCVADILGPERPENAASQSRLRALDFFAESLSAFEMALRGYRETNAQLHRNLNDVLEIQRHLREQNDGLVLASEAAAAERRRYEELLDFEPDAYLVTGADGIIMESNSAAGSLLGTTRARLAGQSLLPFIAEEAECRAELERFRSESLERHDDWLFTVNPKHGEPVLVAATVAATPGGERLRWLLRDVTERRRAQEAREQALAGQVETEAARRFEFLAEASRLLASSQDYETTLASVAQLAVPVLGDWCFFHILESDGSIWQVAAACSGEAGADPTARQLILRPHRGMPPELFATIQRLEILEPLKPEWLEQFAGDPQRAAALRAFAFQSAMVAPLLVRSRVLGALTFLNTGPARAKGSARALADDFARCCAMALDNGRLYREVLQERDRAKKASRAKDEFLAILSHELRNPLTPMLGWTRILKNNDKIREDPVLSEAIGSLERSSRHIGKLVGDCLDLTRISRGTIELSKSAIDLNQVVQASVEIVSETAAKKGLKLIWEPAPRPLPVLGDTTRLQQVVLNLLLNAVAYTDRGGRLLVLSSEHQREAECAVQDTGAGIEPGRLEEIFRPFSVGARTWLRSKSGMGLGLAIARRIVEMHGGRIWAESGGSGLGSIFRLRLPLTSTEPSGQSAGDAPPRQLEEREPLSVLVVEDSRDILFLMRVELEKLGYEVFTAEDATQALALLERKAPDAIISDIKMPGIDGYELIQRVRAMRQFAELPAVALTGFGMPADVERALLAGFDASVTKPAEADEIDALIRRIVKSQKSPVPQGTG